MNMVSEYEIKKQICDIGKRIYDRGMVAANDGNISVKISDNEFLCTPTGVSKGFMTPDYICKVDANGNVIQANKGFKPSSEIKMHMRVYQERPDVKSVVHAHPMYATGFAIAGIPLNQPIMPEAIIALGEVPIAAYGTPSTMEIPDSLMPYLQDYDAILLANHGALTFGCDLNTAFFRMESTEFYAKLLMYARLLGGEKEIPCGEVKKLIDLRKNFNVPGHHPMEKLCPSCYNDAAADMTPTEAAEKFGGASSDANINDIVAEVTKRVMEKYNK